MSARIYAYGANAPTTNHDLVTEQLWLVHRYRNRLVELERERRGKVDAALRDLSPRLAELEVEITASATAIEELDVSLKQKRVVARGRPKASKEDAARKKELKATLGTLRKERKNLRTDLFAGKWAECKGAIAEWTVAEQKTVRAESGLYWGSYLPVEEAAKSFRKGAPPRFRRWRGDSKVAVQLQGGLSIDELLGGNDTRLRLDLRESGVWTGEGRVCTDGTFRRRKLGNALVSIRIGSDDKRKPIWATVPITWHRDLPPGSVIKWAYLHRRIRGTKEVWEFQVVLVGEDGVFDRPDRASSGAVGIDVGWRKFDDRLRVAVWAASDGSEGELSLPAWWLSESRRVERIRGHRDLLLDEAKARTKEQIKSLGDVPEWLEEAGKAMHQWRSAARLASVCLRWRRERSEEPSLSTADAVEVLAELEAWRQRDKHLLEYEAHLRHQLQGSRRDLYRRFAVRMSRAHAKAAIEDMDLRVFHKLAPVEKGGSKEDDAKTAYARDACLSALIGALKERMREIELVDPMNTTKKCHACDDVDEAWVDHAAVDHECPSCGLLWDQDVNAARNILGMGAGGKPVAWARPPIAPTERMSYHKGENRAQRRARKRRELAKTADLACV